MSNSNSKDYIGDLNIKTSEADELIIGLKERQKTLLESIPNYVVKTILIGVGILVIWFSLQALTGKLADEEVQLFNSFRNLTIGGFFSFVFTIVAYAINALFAVWAVSFVPYFIYKSYTASQYIKIPIKTNASNWIQLFAAGLLLIIVFSIFAFFILSTNSSFIIKFDFKDIIVILIGSIICYLILFASIEFIPLKYIVFHLIIFSLLLDAVLFFAFVLGFGTITYGALLGMMVFLMVFSNRLKEFLKRISIYDIDSKMADKLSEVIKQELKNIDIEDETVIVNFEKELKNRRDEKSKNEQEVTNQSSNQIQLITENQNKFNFKFEKVKLDIFLKKLDHYHQLLKFSSSQFEVKFNKELTELLNKFESDNKEKSANELVEEMDIAVSHINNTLGTINKGIDNLLLEMRKAAKELQSETQNSEDG